MANKYNATVLAANAQQLEALAKSARSNMLSRTTEKATRLGAEGERLARQAKATEAQRTDADALAKSHLTEAAQYDAKANSLDQQAASADARHDAVGATQAQELREDAAKQRQGAEVARARSRIAAEDATRLADEAADMRGREKAIDAELADMGGRLPATELAVDNLEWHAEKARVMSDTVRQADELQAQAVSATARGDSVASVELSRRAASLRDDADVLAVVRTSPPFPIDQAALSAIGVELAPGALAVPMPELIDPSALMNPLADASSIGADGIADAATHLAADEPLGSDLSTFASSVAALPDGSADAQSEDESSEDVAVADHSATDTSSVDPSFADPSFADTSFANAASEPPSFDLPVFDSMVAESAFGEPSIAAPDTALEPSLLDDAGGFADPGLVG